MGYYGDTPERFWIVHNVVKMNPLYVILQDIRKFLQQTKEIVIVDFHRFPKGFEVRFVQVPQDLFVNVLCIAQGSPSLS